MSFASHLNSLLPELLLNSSSYTPKAEDVLPLLDLTLLDEEASQITLQALFAQGIQYRVAAICVYPKHLPYPWAHDQVQLAAVANFPQGELNSAQTLQEIRQAQALGVQEIDYVFPYQAYLQGDKQQALECCREVMDYCRQSKLTTKVILETGAYPSLDLIYQAGLEVIATGCDFLKTSTGKINQGANFSAAFALLSAIADSGKPCGLKLSGGVRTLEQALSYMKLAYQMLGKTPDPSWFRLGASSLLKEVTDELLRG